MPTPLPASRWLWGVVFCGVLSGCPADDTSVWQQFNDGDDAVEIHVGSTAPGIDEACDEGEVCADLHSIIEGLVIGSASVSPGWGPVGTVHDVVVVVGDDWEDLVGRVTIEPTGDRGDQVFELRQDSANAGAWGVDLESLGAPDEQRVDTWAVRLWESVPEEQVSDTQSTAGATAR